MTPRTRFRIEIALAVTTALLAVFTAAVPHWIETVLNVDPDAGSGAAEWGIIAALTAATVALGVAARSTYRRGRVAAAGAAARGITKDL